ncbi:mycofactocin system glycosyltransferase [Nocardioides sp. BGMRC 2183]|nr:mycofactocin system glycosyltransferase [Nocardioides sp. BGMRC 2183]
MTTERPSGRQEAVAGPRGTGLPAGFRVRLRDDLVRADRGRVLIGGSPARVVRLTESAVELLADGTLTVDGPGTAPLARRLLEGNLAEPILDDTPVSMASLTVVVPVRDRPVQLDRCLAALVPLRVIVVDDASLAPDAVADVVRRHGADLIALPANLGPAGARNAGLAAVTTPLVAFVDSDVTVEPTALRDLARHFTDPRVAMVGPRVAGRLRSERPSWFERYDAAASSLDLGTQGNQVRPGAEVGWLPSACLVARADALVGDPAAGGAGGVGGFEPDWRVAEDVDLVWRLVDAGHVVRYDPDVVAGHDVRPSLRGWLGRKFVYGTGGADLAARHGDKVAPARLSAAMAVGAAAVLQRRWWSLPVAAATIGLTARSLAPKLPAEHDTARVSALLATRGLGWAVRQEAGLLLRHWWPLAALTAPFSRSVRRATTTAILVDLIVFLRDRRGVAPLLALLARRLDDLAYGAGLWVGAIRRRSGRCLAVRRVR